MSTKVLAHINKHHTVYTVVASLAAFVVSAASLSISLVTCSQNQKANEVAMRSNAISLKANTLTAEANEKSLNAANEANTLSRKSLSMAEEANKIARDAMNDAKTYSRVALEVQWSSLRSKYEEVDKQISEWEQSMGYERNGTPANSMDELLSVMDKLKAPEKIKRLYVARNDARLSLENAATLYEAEYKDRLAAIDFALPAVPEPPRLPLATLSRGTISGGTIR